VRLGYNYFIFFFEIEINFLKFLLQDRLLSEYERELISKKLEKSRLGDNSANDDLSMNVKDDMIIVGGAAGDSSPIEKGC